MNYDIQCSNPTDFSDKDINDYKPLTNVENINKPFLIFILYKNNYYCFTQEELEKLFFYIPGSENDKPFVLQEAVDDMKNQEWQKAIKNMYVRSKWVYSIPYINVYVDMSFINLLNYQYDIIEIIDNPKDVILYRSVTFHDYKTKLYPVKGININLNLIYNYFLHNYITFLQETIINPNKEMKNFIRSVKSDYFSGFLTYADVLEDRNFATQMYKKAWEMALEERKNDEDEPYSKLITDHALYLLLNDSEEDKKLAREYFRIGSDIGDNKNKIYYIKMLLFGVGGEKDEKLAREIIEKDKEKYDLEELYPYVLYYGIGGYQDKETAKQIFEDSMPDGNIKVWRIYLSILEKNEPNNERIKSLKQEINELQEIFDEDNLLDNNIQIENLDNNL